MPKWTFPLELDLAADPANAGEAQRICAKIESALLADRDLERDLTNEVVTIICLQPSKGIHLCTSTEREP